MKFDADSNPFAMARAPHFARNGMVATSHPLAAQAGLDALKAGGNAVDAAIATAACLTVVEPTSNGIGADAFAIVWMRGQMHGLNSSGPAPKSLGIAEVLALGHKAMPQLGWIPVTVPGAPAAWAELSARFGKLGLARCLAQAIDYAKNGHPVAPVVARNWKRAFAGYKARLSAEDFAHWAQAFAPKGRAPEAGETWRSADQGATLEEIAGTKGESFYRGALARAIAAHSAERKGFLSMADLESYAPQWVTPISVNYRGYDVWEIPPNGQGLVALIALNVLKAFDFPAREKAEAFHKAFEAMKLSYCAGKEFIAEPGSMKFSAEEFLTESFAEALRAKIGATACDPAPVTPAGGGTVYLCAADSQGNMVSYIQSNYMGFGSGVVVPGTGIALQNRGADFSLDPGHANALEGGKRCYHTIIPGFLTRAGRAVGPFGVMGGYMQPQGHVQVVMNAVDFGMNPQAALDAPRWQWISGRSFEVEHHFPLHIARELQEAGHTIVVPPDSGSFGRGQIVWRDDESGALCGGTESRCDGAVSCW